MIHIKQAQKLAVTVIDLWLHGDISHAKSVCERRINELKKRDYTAAYLARLQTTYRREIINELKGRGLVWSGQEYILDRERATTEPRENYPFTKYPVSLFGGTYEYSTGRRNSSLREAVDRKNDQTEQNVEARNLERVPVTAEILDKIYERVEVVLTNFVQGPDGSKRELYGVATAIVLATGRRPFLEVLQDLRFSLRDQDQRLDVSGISKKGELAKSKSYQVNVVGVSPEIVKQAHDRLILTLSEECSWYTGDLDNDRIRNATNQQMKTAIGQYRPFFKSVVVVGWGKTIGSLHSHDGRAIYVQECLRRYQEKTGRLTRDFDEFAGNVLLHETTTRSGEVKRSSKTAQFYKRFQLVATIPNYEATDAEIIL